MNIKGGFGTVFADAIEHKKLISADNWKLNTAAAAIPIIFLGNIFNNLYQYTASQDVVQRYQASDSLKETNKSLLDKWYPSFNFSTLILWYGYNAVFILYT